MERHSIYDAKAKLSAIIRVVKNRRRVCITERGRDVAWVIPAPRNDGEAIDERLDHLVQSGLIVGGHRSPADIAPSARRKGALARFLAERDE